MALLFVKELEFLSFTIHRNCQLNVRRRRKPEWVPCITQTFNVFLISAVGFKTKVLSYNYLRLECCLTTQNSVSKLYTINLWHVLEVRKCPMRHIKNRPSVLWEPLTLLVGRQERHLACKNMRRMGEDHRLVRMEWRPARWSVLIFHCTTKSRSSLLAPAHPGGPGKRGGHKTVVVVVDRMIKVLHPTQHKIGHSGDALPSQSLG